MIWPGGADWLCLFLEYLIKTSLALSIALLLASMLRSRPASIRHFVLSFFLIGLLLLPVFSEFHFGWETNLLPAPDSAGHDMQTTVPPAQLTAVRPEDSRPESIAGAWSATGSRDSARSSSEIMILLSETGSTRGITGISLLLLWAAGFAILLLRLGLGILGAYRLTRKGENLADPLWKTLLARFLAVLRLRRAVRLKSHREVAVPFTWGFFRPVILVPAGHEQWTEDQRSSALLHEVSHIKRADFAVMLLVRLSRAVFWFNPLTWIVFRTLKKEQERACDDLVLAAGIKPSAYAAALLSFKRSSGFRDSPSPAFPGLLGGASFNERLAAILRERLTGKEVTMKTKLILAIVVSLSVALIGMARPSRATFESPEKPPEVGLAAWPSFMAASAQASVTAGDREDQEKMVEAQSAQEKKEEQRKIVGTDKKGEFIPLEVTIMTGDQSRTIKVGEAITLKKGEGNELILINKEGKELKILEGETIRLRIQDKDLVLVKEGEALKLVNKGAIGLVTKKDLAGDLVLSVAPRVKVMEAGTGAAEKFEVVVPSIQVGEHAFVTLPVVKNAEIKKKLEELRDRLDQTKQVDATEIREAVNDVIADLSSEQGKPARVAITGDRTAEIKKKLQELLEKLDPTKQVDAAEIRNAIKEIISDLDKQGVRDRVAIKVGESPKSFYIVQGKEGAGQGWVLRRSDKDTLTLNTVMVHKDDQKTFSVVYRLDMGESSKAVYEKIVERVRQELPEGYTLDPEFNEKSGAITLKFSGTGAEGVSTEFIKKLTDIIKGDVKKLQFTYS